MTTQWHCINCGYIFKTYKPSIDNKLAGLADGQGLRNSQAGKVSKTIRLLIVGIVGMEVLRLSLITRW